MGQPFNTEALHRNASAVPMSQMFLSGMGAFWQVNLSNYNCLFFFAIILFSTTSITSSVVV
jgi:hypothetical protein